MADIFKNIGKGAAGILSGAGQVAGGVGKGVFGAIDVADRAIRPTYRLRVDMEDLRQKLSMPINEKARASLVNSFWGKHESEIMRLQQGQGVYQPQQDGEQFGVVPGEYQYLGEEERPEAARVQRGLSPRTGRTPGTQEDVLGQMKVWQAILKGTLDPTWGKILEGQRETFDLATKKIGELRKQLAGQPVPGQPEKTDIFRNITQRPDLTPEVRRQADAWLGEPEQETPITPAPQVGQPSKRPSFMTRLGLGIDKVAGKGMDRYQALEQRVDKAFRKQPKSKTPRADAAQNADQALMWLHWEVPLSREISARVQQYKKGGYKSEAIVKALRSFPDMSKITVEELDKVMQGETAPKTLTELEVRALLDEAGGDTEKARELAKQRNWTIPK